MLWKPWESSRAVAQRFRLLLVVVLQCLLFAPLARGQAGSPGSQRQALGSLNTSGEVFVNDSRAPSELTIFAGDSLRTGASGTALLSTAAGSSYQVSPGSQVVFAGDPRYLADLKSGALAVKSASGPGRAVVRAGDFVIVPTILNSQTVYRIERAGDGSFLITCTIGNIGIVPMQGAPGLFLEAGQSATISAKNELIPMQQPSQTASASPSQTQSQGAGRSTARNYKPLIYLGLAGGGAAAAAVALTHTSRPVVSPSAP